jgi:D-amino-acid dehydrogenase
LYEQTIHWLPHLASYEKAFHSCSRPVSADDVPLIGRCGDFDNLFVNCGHGSKGWTLAFGSAALLANVINQKAYIKGTKEIDPEPYSPNRFE